MISLPAAAVLGAAEEALRKGVQGARRHLGRVRRDRQRGRAAPGRAARARARARRAPDRAELPRHRLGRDEPERDLRRARRRRAGTSASPRRAARSASPCSRRRRRAGSGSPAFVSIGNKADVSSNDLLEWWEDDPATDVVLLYVESFGNPRRFARLARRVARRKPVLALKSGTTASGQRAASSHTAALAGSEAAVDALFHQAGVIRAASLEELVDVAALLSSQPEPKGRQRRRAHERGRARHPLRRRLRGGRARAAGALRRDGRGARRAALAGGERREPGRHARRGDRRHLRRRRCRPSSPTRTWTP